jgi:hypothetical protein
VDRLAADLSRPAAPGESAVIAEIRKGRLSGPAAIITVLRISARGERS